MGCSEDTFSEQGAAGSTLQVSLLCILQVGKSRLKKCLPEVAELVSVGVGPRIPLDLLSLRPVLCRMYHGFPCTWLALVVSS